MTKKAPEDRNKAGKKTPRKKVTEEKETQGAAGGQEEPVRWGSYSLGTALIICWFMVELLRAGYGAVIHLSGRFGEPALGGALLVYGGLMLAASLGLILGTKRGIQVALAGLGLSAVGHAAFALGYGAASPLTEVVGTLVVVGLGVRYLLAEPTASLALQPRDALAVHVKVLQGFIAGFGLLCLAAILLILWEPYGQVPLGMP